MKSLNFETVEALVYDPVAANRSAMRAALSAFGIRHVDSVAAPVDFAYANFRRNPDIIFCEIASSDTLLCDQIQAVRSGAVGNNPFVVIVATTWDHSEALVKRVINSGADDLILRPFSNGILALRLESLAERRKGFVITHDYIGPDRRRDPKRVSSGLFNPPNSLKIKAVDHLSPQVAERRLAKELLDAKGFLASEKLRVDVFQLGVLGRFLQEEPYESEPYIQHRERLATLARSIATRGTEAKISGVDMWCKEVLSAADALDRDDAMDRDKDRAETFRFLERAAASLFQIVNPAKTIEDYQTSLQAAMDAIHARAARLRTV
jgi:DNA-binding response OmpR family regulator